MLIRHGVDFLDVGGAAAILLGSPQTTIDLDIVPLKAGDNLERLSAALRELNARIEAPDVPGGLPFHHDAASLARSACWTS